MVTLVSFTRTCLFAHADRSENMRRANIRSIPCNEIFDSGSLFHYFDLSQEI